MFHRTLGFCARIIFWEMDPLKKNKTLTTALSTHSLPVNDTVLASSVPFQSCLLVITLFALSELLGVPKLPVTLLLR